MLRAGRISVKRGALRPRVAEVANLLISTFVILAAISVFWQRPITARPRLKLARARPFRKGAGSGAAGMTMKMAPGHYASGALATTP